jgi:hypothetical protein
MKQSLRQPEAGTAIVLVISILATLIVIVGIAAEYTTIVSRNVQRSLTLQRAVAIADGCLESNFARWRQLCQMPPQPLPTTNELAALALPTQAQFPDIPNFTVTSANYDPSNASMVQQCKVIAVDPEEVPMDPNTRPIASVGHAGNGDNTFNYLATAYVTLPALRGNVVAKVQRIFQEQQLSPWNYAIFYNDPLEIHPGPDFYINGWVHTNGNLYTDHKSLHFMDKATFSGQWYIDFMPGDASHDPNDPANGSPSWPMNPEIRPDFDSTHQPFNLDASTFDASNPNNTGYHELIEPPVLPLASYPDPLSGWRYFDQAGVIIQVTDNPNPALPDIVQLMRPNGDGTATTLTSTSTGEDKTLYDMFHASGVITTNQTFQDNREQAVVRVTTIDVSKLTKSSGTLWNKTGSPFNGIIYVYDPSAAANGVGAKRGVRLKNGARIPSGGLTVASANPVYIQGDYNTGSNPPSNNGDPTTPQAPGYTRQPCSVIADAVNILSGAWNDATSFGTASNTTVNTAILSGIVPSGNGNYSGGAENFPRFLENWTNKTLTYYGSMVELYNSQQAIGRWQYGSPIYNAPLRKWYFDTNFRLKSPPGTLLTFTYSKGRWSLVP